ncbi:MAG TPA: S8 family serine peptidase, partial [Cellulomonas sp.]
ARANIPVVASSGDSGVAWPGRKGRRALYPVTDPNVTAVGGTLLTLDQHGNREVPDIAWGPDAKGGASGGGVSRLDPRPSWQATTPGTSPKGRTYPDISMTGATSGGMVLALADLAPDVPVDFAPVGGTSVAAPIFAGVLALVRQRAGHPLHAVNRALYRLARAPRRNGIVDVVLGNNSYGNAKDDSGQGTQIQGFIAQPGYDAVTGLGTIDPPRFIPALARATTP